MTTYAAALLAHILIVVFLLGVEPGRLYLARLAAAEATPVPARLAAARAARWLGAIGNAALVLILPAGVSLGAALGVFRIMGPVWLAATWVVTAAWLALSVAADRAAGRPGGGAWLTRMDTGFRLLMGAGQVYDGIIALAGTNVSVDERWLGAKILVFGLLILVSIPARRAGFALARSAAELGADPADAAASGRLARAAAAVAPPVIAGALLILAAAWLGVAKPF
jgi:hypothetical protein